MLKGNPEITLYNRELPKGCELCRLGGKIVVFISGECGDNCYYCPVSDQRFGKDLMFANEKRTTNLYDFIYEAYKMNALGAGITGGDPILHLDRVIKLIHIFKEEFGKEFHVHLYTSGRYVNHDALEALQEAGLDEIRFHPLKLEYLKSIEKALQYNFDVGIEVPSIPGEEDYLKTIIQWAIDHKVKFVNLNELEITERNYQNLNAKGLKISHGLAGSEGSYNTALQVLKIYEYSDINLHYCSSVYKDVVETRTRFLRTIRMYAKPYEEYSGEGTIIRAKIKTSNNIDDYGEKIDNEHYVVSPFIVDEILKKYDVDEVLLEEELPYGLRISEKLVYSKSK
ncbi:radical SAM protein [Acidianus sulfidivorans JP7]|uniref:Radical SAM protein n=1 Tax=Acidianus sulfidivorans JP7 TaxID=619593 RepID=A0A2U9IM82_9CREN|nr:radical SAM protein [Acidianus sulfidivorans]AWR97127.1 radical SAM protein [Acidianus sulfidivorans JP7]